MSTGDWIQTGVLAATLLGVLWYAWEARKQAKGSVTMARYMNQARFDAARPVIEIDPLSNMSELLPRMSLV